MKVILIGEAPPRKKRGVLDYRMFDGLRCERVNLLKRWPGRAGKGSLFPAKAARRAAIRMKHSARLRGKLIILIGKRVASAFEQKTSYLSVSENIVTFPHPSGINHWWNDQANRRLARRFMERLKQCAS